MTVTQRKYLEYVLEAVDVPLEVVAASRYIADMSEDPIDPDQYVLLIDTLLSAKRSENAQYWVGGVVRR